jgi:hypothetical protein
MRYYLIAALLLVGTAYFAWTNGLSGAVQSVKNHVTTTQNQYNDLFKHLK